MKAALLAAFRAAVAAADPAHCLPAHLPAAGPGRTLVAGAGKAAARMAEVLAGHYQGEVTGVVVTRYGHGLAPGVTVPGIRVMEAGHPVPDDAALAAGREVLALAAQAGPGDRFIMLLSGGASALLEQPLADIGLPEIRALTACLLNSGASIAAINCVRRQLSAIKGGRLALVAAPADVYALAISDVPGDRFADIGSGPCSPDPGTQADARAVLARFACPPSPAVARVLNDPRRASPPAGHPAFARVRERIVVRSADAVAAAAASLSRRGIASRSLGDDLDAPATALAAEHASLVRHAPATAAPFALLSGGETSHRVTHPGRRGGRNTAYLLALALALDGLDGVWALAADTDGLDGYGGHAGALLGPDTLARARAAGLDGAAMLAEDRSHDFFAALDDLVVTGPTRTNVNDLRIILVMPARGAQSTVADGDGLG